MQKSNVNLTTILILVMWLPGTTRTIVHEILSSIDDEERQQKSEGKMPPSHSSHAGKRNRLEKQINQLAAKKTHV